ncbi:oligosaccharyl transferase, archaeosortase A system-associated [Haloarchaeobius sp. HME9146]|uniref:oligosaccharyl transferase, archaeosortase A system-associated n=1 Tax=Haloarchaeobius sp. HME9146 TaxID=2978732 RepID=UPI0021BF9DD1|nr:oligosaccharyl transferase, archaeosortase A system-associated [Haloarchaeobius sp. HME9146]MCT9097020.1 oligosaccharyl transferase, archaeosortase A system-associated [Haloarchaeobius sp. HME9146]
MSTSTGEQTESEQVRSDSVIELFKRWYHVPSVGLIMAFMLWVRLQPLDNFTRNGEVFYAGNDAWYHLRQVSYTVRHWPTTMPYDVYSEFPTGVRADQFGTLFDQLVATGALIVGLGDPSQHTIAMTLLVAPAVFGMLVAIPTYLIGKRVAGRFGGVTAALVLALLPGVFLRRSTAGFSDHHVAEVLFQALTVLGIMVALRSAEREKPVYELVADRDWDAMRTPGKWAALAGISAGLYMWVWPPAAVLLGILGVFFAIALSIEYIAGRSPDHLAFTGVVVGVTSAFTVLLSIDQFSLGVTSLSPLQVGLGLGLAAGCAFMAWLARTWDTMETETLRNASLASFGLLFFAIILAAVAGLPFLGLPFALILVFGGLFGGVAYTRDEKAEKKAYYPVAISSILVAGLGALKLVAPGAFGILIRNVNRTIAFAQSDTTLTIGEAQAVVGAGEPFVQTLTQFMGAQYGLTYVVAAAAFVWLVWDLYSSDKYRSELLFVLVWSTFMFLMAMTQVRFNYYFVVSVAVLNGFFIGRIVQVVGIPDVSTDDIDVEPYQVMSIVAVIMLVVMPLTPVLAMTSTTVDAQADSMGPGSVMLWDNSTDWMRNSTPAPGKYGGANNELGYYETYENQDDFAYPEGAYGVMSWWDYGHWITVKGERIPVANPFQHNAKAASDYLLAQNETHANLLLEALPNIDQADKPVDQLSNEDLQRLVDQQNDQQASEDTRYVMIDYQMASSKFGAIATWTGPDPQTYYTNKQVNINNSSVVLPGMGEQYERTMLSRLYFDDANGLEHYRLVHENPSQVGFASLAVQQNGRWQAAAVNRALNIQQLLQYQFSPQVHVYDTSVESVVKTYERVPGATVAGQADVSSATNVTAKVQLKSQTTNRTFNYTQTVQTDDQGNFEITVPYATDDSLTVEDGSTDTVVEATGEYTITVEDSNETGTVAVPESAIMTEDGEPITVELSAATGSSNSTVSTDAASGSESESAADEDQPRLVRTEAGTLARAA